MKRAAAAAALALGLSSCVNPPQAYAVPIDHALAVQAKGKLPYIHTKAERKVKPSLYHGKWFRPKADVKRRCIVWRESRGQYRVVNRSSGSAGAYQFMLSTSNYVARDLIHKPRLVGIPASAWPRKVQDRAFWRLWAKGKGKHHWRGGAYSCGF